METKNVILATAIATVLLVVMVGSASAVTVIDSCDFNANTQNEYYVLGQNLTCGGSEHGINIGTSDIVIDGYNETDDKYYWIDGGSPATCDPFTYWSGICDEGGNDNVTINNLEIKNFCNGIYLGSAGLNEYYTIENCKVHDIGTGPTHGMNFNMVCNSMVTGCEIYNNTGTGSGCGAGGDGIYLMGSPGGHGYARNNIITDNNIYDNRKAGIFMKAAPDRNTISYNNLWGNGQPGAGEVGGIVLRCKKSYNNTITHNNVSDNTGSGIYLGGGKNSVTQNNVTGNKNSGTVQGIGLKARRCDEWPPGTENNTIYYNRFCFNDYKDIDVADVCTAHINGDNNTCQNCSGYVGDESAPAGQCCVYQCVPPVQPDLIIEDIRAIGWCCCCVNEMQVMFVDDPKLAKELGDEKLREEVADALAKDPKSAAEIAVKLADGDTEALAKFTSEPEEFIKLEFAEAADKLISNPELVDSELIARCCCCCCNTCFNAIPELADLLDTELTAQKQHEMSDLLDQIGRGGRYDDYKSREEYDKCCCCCCGRFIVYKIANNGTGNASWSLSNLTVDGHVRSADIVRPLDVGQSRWEIFPCYRMWWWPWHHEVAVCADATDWVAESNETNNCLTKTFS